MRKHSLLILIAVAIIFHLATLSDAAVVKSDLVKRKQDSPYRPYGIYNYAYKNKKKKKKHKDNDYKDEYSKRHINRRDADPEEVKKRLAPVSQGTVPTSFTPGATNP